MGKPWESVPCLNTELGNKVKPLKPVEVRQALCQAGLSPIGDKNELLKRLAIHYSTLTGGSSGKIKKVLKIKVTQINYVSRNQLHCTANLNFGLMCKKAKHC